jgi:hypothetical protein
VTPDLALVTLTESQIEQLRDFLEEKDHTGSIALSASQNLPDAYLELVLLDQDGEPTQHKRILFPT